MRFPKLSFIPLALACLMSAAVEPAVSEQAAATQAMSAEDPSLGSDYVALTERAVACTGGLCADAANIRSDFNALEVRRAALTPSNAQIDLLASSLLERLAGWEEQS